MQNITADLSDWITRNVDLYSPIIQNTFLYKNVDEIMARQEPSDATVTIYMDESRSSTADISYSTKSDEMEKAERQLTSIVNRLSNNQIEISDGCVESIEVVSSPAFQHKTESNEYVFSSTISVSYII